MSDLDNDNDAVITRVPEDLQSGVLVTVLDLTGNKIIVDSQEYQELYNADLIMFPLASDQVGQTLAEVYPGYDPFKNNLIVTNTNNMPLMLPDIFGVRP